MNKNKLGRKVNKRLAQKNVHFFSDDFQNTVYRIIDELKEDTEIKEIACGKTRAIGRLNGTIGIQVVELDMYFSEYHDSNPDKQEYIGMFLSDCGAQIQIEHEFENEYEIIDFIKSI